MKQESPAFRHGECQYVRNGAKKNKEVLLERLNRELDTLRNQVKWKEEEIRKVLIEN